MTLFRRLGYLQFLGLWIYAICQGASQPNWVADLVCGLSAFWLVLSFFSLMLYLVRSS